MPPLPPGAVLQHIRQVLEAPGESGQLDQDLLRDFAARRDEAAFAALLRRHGRLVLGVCRRVLGNVQDAEDVFQATFLVLARKAGSIRKAGSVGSWLHGVAYRLAMKERARSGRRRQEERKAADSPAIDPAADFSWRELQEVLDQELGGLPEKFRSPLLLCYLEGKTQDEAARQLGWSMGTFRRRLDQGRELLRGRLTRRGLALSAVLFPALLGQGAVAAPIPLLVSTLQGATAFALGEVAAIGAVSAKVVVLAEEVMRAMLLTQLKYVAAAVVLVAGLAGTGTLIHHYAVGAVPPTAPVAGLPGTARLVPADTETSPEVFSREVIESLLKLPNQLPPLQPSSKEKPLRFEDFPRYTRKVLLPYAADGKESVLRESVKQTYRLIADKNKDAFPDTLAPAPENKQARIQFMNQLVQRQMQLGQVCFALETNFEELKALTKMRDKDTPRWQANFDYALAQLQIRMAYFYEYNAALGRARKDDLPALDKKVHKGYRLVPIDQVGDRDAKKLADSARKLLQKLVEDHKGTPWEVIAKRALATKIGIEWKAY